MWRGLKTWGFQKDEAQEGVGHHIPLHNSTPAPYIWSFCNVLYTKLVDMYPGVWEVKQTNRAWGKGYDSQMVT